MGQALENRTILSYPIPINNTAVGVISKEQYDALRKAQDTIVFSNVPPGKIVKGYGYKPDKFRAIQKLESKSDYCDSIAVVNDSIIHHQRDRIAIQSAFIHTDSLALSSERETSKALQLQLNNQIQATKREKRKKAIPWGVAFILGCLVILK